jgi:hypothetical protein
MEITSQIAKAPKAARNTENYFRDAAQPKDVFITCAFAMVSLDPVAKTPVNIAPLVLSTPAERTLYAKGEENHRAKKALKEFYIMQKAPDAEESALTHKMWTDSVAYADSKTPPRKRRT